MGKLDERHFLPNKEDREYNGNYHPIYKLATPNKKEFERIENVLEEVTCDVVNGLPKSDILLKLKNGEYDSQSKGIGLRRANEYYSAVMSRLRVDSEEQIENARNIITSMYLNIYRECMEIGNHIGAKGALDSLSKVIGLDRPQQTNIQINNNDDGLTINFNLPKNDESDI